MEGRIALTVKEAIFALTLEIGATHNVALSVQSRLR